MAKSKRPYRKRRSSSTARRKGRKSAATRSRQRRTGAATKATRRKSTARRRPAKRKVQRNRLLAYGADAGVFVLTTAAAIMVGLVFLSQDLPSTDNIWRANKVPSITLVASDGSPMIVQGEARGAPVRLTELPSYVPDAVLAVEDRNFRHHFGVNPVAIARAFIVNASEGEVRQGGSTLTQQLAKNLFLSSERTYKRKLQELMLSFWLEYRFSKDEILTLYLNRVYFGGGAHGIDAASYRYFDKPARRLTLNEAAILAGLLKAPSKYAPTTNPQDAGARALTVINSMVEAGFLEAAEAKKTVRDPVLLGPSSLQGAPYFNDYAISAARHASNQADEDLVVRTTFDPILQAALEAGIAQGTRTVNLPDDIQIAGVILDQNGAVRAMVGGRDYSKSQFNRAAQAQRQTGSAFKPLVYLTAFEDGYRPEDFISGEPFSVGNWTPKNYTDKDYGEVTVEQALARSLNSATIRLQETVGRSKVRRIAEKSGFGSDLTTSPSMGLGVDAVSPIKLAGVYAAFANDGYAVRIHSVDRITNVEGGVLYQSGATHFEKIATTRSIRNIDRLLHSVVTSGTGRAAAINGVRVAGKTGTTQNNRDAWFVGYAGDLVCVIWLGKDNNSPMQGITGGGAPAKIWREVMARAVTVKLDMSQSVDNYRESVAIEDDPVAALLEVAREN